MENTPSKTDLLNPLLLKVGVPLTAISLAGLIYAWIIARKSLSSRTSSRNPLVDSLETNDNTQQGAKHEESSHTLASKEDKDPNSVSRENPRLEQEITGLRSQIEGLQKRESDLRLQFDRYCDMKEQESLLTQIINLLSLETARVEFLEKEISFMEAESSKLEGFLVQYMRIIEQLEGWKSENRLLRRKLKKLRRKSKAQSRLTKEQTLKIKAQEAEILENRVALQTRIDVIDQLKDEIKGLHNVSEQLQDEKNELLKKLDEAEKSYASKVEALETSKEEYKQLVKEMAQLKKKQEDEVKELIHLRWINACLRHELMRQQKNEERDRIKEKSEGSDGVLPNDSDDSVLGNDHHTMACFGDAQRSSKLLKRLKRWMEGSDKARVNPVEKDGHESHTASDGADKTLVPA